MSTGSILLQFIIIILLTMVNAFFASSEMAIVSVNKNRIRLLAESGNSKAQLLLKMVAEPSKLLATMQVGITLAGFFSSASAATGISDDFAILLGKLNIPYSQQVSLILITIILSFLTLVFGELFPKRVAMQNAEKISMLVIRPIYFISKLTKPFIKLLSSVTNLLVRLTGIERTALEERVSKEEIKLLVEVGQEHGVINETEKSMINSIFGFDDILAQEVMTPRTEVFLLDINSSTQDYMEELLRERYSRVPVFEGDQDNIIGILFLKDLLCEAYKNGFENVDIRSILHTPSFVPETKNIDELFKDLQRTQNHMAILIDEYGGFSGIATIEDLIEEVMGDIDDEFDQHEPNIKKIDNHTYIVNGLLSINELNDALNLEIESEHSDTLGGLVMVLLGSIPVSGEDNTVEYKNITFKVEEVKERRIEKVKMVIQ